MNISLDQYIASRLHGSENQWTRRDWQQSFDMYSWLDGFRKGLCPLPAWLMHEGVRIDHDTPAPSLFISQSYFNWFAVAGWRDELKLNVDFKPAPDLGTIRQAHLAAGGEAETLVVVYPGERPGTFYVSVEGLYVPVNSAAQRAVQAVFGIAPNGYPAGGFTGWEWTAGWP